MSQFSGSHSAADNGPTWQPSQVPPNLGVRHLQTLLRPSKPHCCQMGPGGLSGAQGPNFGIFCLLFYNFYLLFYNLYPFLQFIYYFGAKLVTGEYNLTPPPPPPGGGKNLYKEI